jgi:hypothetical protein
MISSAIAYPAHSESPAMEKNIVAMNFRIFLSPLADEEFHSGPIAPSPADARTRKVPDLL